MTGSGGDSAFPSRLSETGIVYQISMLIFIGLLLLLVAYPDCGFVIPIDKFQLVNIT